VSGSKGGERKGKKYIPDLAAMPGKTGKVHYAFGGLLRSGASKGGTFRSRLLQSGGGGGNEREKKGRRGSDWRRWMLPRNEGDYWCFGDSHCFGGEGPVFVAVTLLQKGAVLKGSRREKKRGKALTLASQRGEYVG